jgi:hypothetical protein
MILMLCKSIYYSGISKSTDVEFSPGVVHYGSISIATGRFGIISEMLC